MVWSSYMKFWQQFEIHKFCVCAKFQGNESRNFRPENYFKSLV